MHEERVAVGLRLGDPSGAERAARASDVLNDNLLTRVRDIGSAISRVTVSVGPPAENGTTIVIVPDG